VIFSRADYTDLPGAKKLHIVSHIDATVTRVTILPLLALALSAIAAEETPEALDPQRLEEDQVVIGNIIFEKQDVFDLSDPKENSALYRLANRLHIITKDEVIAKQLLLSSGDVFSQRLAAESERILRANTYFYDASISPKNRKDGTVDLHVVTRDVWTLRPSISYSRSGGENKSLVRLEELNLLGRGQKLLVSRSSDVDRNSTLFEFRDKHLGNSWTALNLLAADNSDGHSSLFSLVRPFYALDARWAAGMQAYDDERISPLYQLGEKTAEYGHERRYFSAFGGWSAGLRDGWVRRFTAGAVYDDNQFADSLDPALALATPDDRKFVYPYMGIEILQDQYEKTTNRDQIDKTEDFLTGTRFTASLGWSDEEFGADRDAFLYSLGASRSFGNIAKSAVLLSVDASGRVENSHTVNALFGFDARYYRQQSEKRTFFTTFSAIHGNRLDLDNPIELGGDTGLRGYPIRYQSGNSKMLLTIEQRYFSDWYPFRLVRVGAAIFADVGRTWGDNPLGGESLGWLADVGVGLRFAPTRTGSRKIIHLDVAFPLNGDESIDSVQIQVESKRSF